MKITKERKQQVKPLLIAILFITVVFKSTILLAFEGNIGTGYVVRQQKQRMGSVLSCRPVDEDIRILNIIKNNSINSPEDYSEWLGKNVKFKKDEGNDTWATAGETLKNKEGDCEDYSFLTEAVLRVLGYSPVVLAAGWDENVGDHAICVFEKGGRYYWFDNAEIKETQATTMVEFARYVFETFGCSYLAEVDLVTKEREVKFKRIV